MSSLGPGRRFGSKDESGERVVRYGIVTAWLAFFSHDQFGRSPSRNARWKRLIWTNEVSLIASFSLSDYIARSMG